MQKFNDQEIKKTLYECKKLNKDGFDEEGNQKYKPCTKKYTSNSSLFMHDLEKHADSFRYTCDNCKFQTNLMGAFQRHERSDKHQRYLQIGSLIEELQKYQIENATHADSNEDGTRSSAESQEAHEEQKMASYASGTCLGNPSLNIRFSEVPKNITNPIRRTLDQTRENNQMKCEFCDEILSYSAMKSHVVRKHLICICKIACAPIQHGNVSITCKNLVRYYCKVPECAKHFYSSKACKKHEVDVHDSPDLKCPEDECNMIFKKQAALDKHITAHEFQKKINNIVKN